MEPEEMYLEETAIRETMEELGVKIKPTGVIANNRNNDTDTFYLVVSAELDNPDDYPKNITLSDEANDFKWVGKDDIRWPRFHPIHGRPGAQSSRGSIGTAKSPFLSER